MYSCILNYLLDMNCNDTFTKKHLYLQTDNRQRKYRNGTINYVESHILLPIAA